MAREVVPLRLSEAEKAAVAKGAAGLGVSISEFLRRAALAAAFRLAEARRPKPEPPQEPPSTRVDGGHVSEVRRPTEPAERHVVTTYESFDAYRNRDGLPPGGAFRFNLADD